MVMCDFSVILVCVIIDDAMMMRCVDWTLTRRELMCVMCVCQ